MYPTSDILPNTLTLKCAPFLGAFLNTTNQQLPISIPMILRTH